MPIVQRADTVRLAPASAHDPRVVRGAATGASVLVTYLGSAASYTRGNRRWIKNGPSILVTEEEWKVLKKVRDPGTGRRLFAQDDTDDDELSEQDVAQYRVGGFDTKKGCLEYARDVFEVQLDPAQSLAALNKQTLMLKERFDSGITDEGLVHGLGGARLLGEGEQARVEVREEEVEATEPVRASGEIDTADKSTTAAQGPKRTRVV
jgi:hypothetical protein